MAHHDDDSRAASCTDAFARLPWWACIALAVASYFLLHALALRPHEIVTDPARFQSALPAIVLQGLLEDLQYLAPLLFLLGVPLARCIAAAEACAVPTRHPC